jgi:hypothetical protein
MTLHEKINFKGTCQKRGEREGLGNYYVLFFNGLIS